MDPNVLNTIALGLTFIVSITGGTWYISGRINTFGGQINALGARMDGMEARLGSMERHFDARLGKLERKVHSINEHLRSRPE